LDDDPVADAHSSFNQSPSTASVEPVDVIRSEGSVAPDVAPEELLLIFLSFL